MQFIECVDMRVEHRPSDDEYFMITRIEYTKNAQESGAAVIETALDVSTIRTRLGPRAYIWNSSRASSSVMIFFVTTNAKMRKHVA